MPGSVPRKCSETSLQYIIFFRVSVKDIMCICMPLYAGEKQETENEGIRNAATDKAAKANIARRRIIISSRGRKQYTNNRNLHNV